MDGFAATASIRALEAGVRKGDRPGGSFDATRSGDHIPVIALTASVLEGDRERCLAAGMDGYLGKPVAMEAVAKVIRGFLP
jgi:two-component system, sensor histidine kinase and response regulator